MLINTDNKIYHLGRAVRPRQWIKNLVVFAPILFHGDILNPRYLMQGILAFIYFCMVASAIYLINDYIDLEKDRLHPIKKYRPMASGTLPISWGLTAAAILLVFAIPTSFYYMGTYFGIILVVYVLLQVAYNLKLKNLIIIDALTISIGFILRVFAGALAIPISISSWLILAIIGLSLLLAFGKRRAEKTVLQAHNLVKEGAKTRKILEHYPDSLLDSMISMSASFSIITYSFFAFHISPISVTGGLLESFLPSTLVSAKFLMLTIPVVIYAVGRYLYVIYEKREGESPERVLLNDRPLLITTVVWGIMVVFIQTDFSTWVV